MILVGIFELPTMNKLYTKCVTWIDCYNAAKNNINQRKNNN